MKSIIATVLALFVSTALLAQAQRSFTFEWDDPNPVDMGVTSYRLHYWLDGSGMTPIVASVKTLNATITFPTRGTWWVCASAVNAEGESDCSNSISVVVTTGRPQPPKDFRIGQ